MPAGLATDIEPATTDDRIGVRRLLDAAALTVDAVDLPARLAAGDVWVVRRQGAASLLGVAVMSTPARGPSWTCPTGGFVHAIAVRRRVRARGLGTALIRRVLEAYTLVTVTFATPVRPFWQQLGFVSTPTGPDRWWGYQLADS